MPYISEELIAYLEKLYPLAAPKPSDEITKIMYDAGRRSVVDHLITVYLAQTAGKVLD